ncbi:MAG TPA: TrmH family RNA methyltransferase [Candidatus Paceibacterota bacterium]|nr:TrmH family RNA methyltransferase [Candidatus Paceibacterota bacterium]
MKSIAPRAFADEKILILHDIRSALNVGALFRTADAVGIDHIYLSSTTPAPIDRFGRADARIAKTALGAEGTIVWEQYDDIQKLLGVLQRQGAMVVAIEQAPRAIDYKEAKIQLPVAFVLGNEVNGVPRAVLHMSDIVAAIPMEGKKESLNVAVAGGVALFRMLGV